MTLRFRFRSERAAGIVLLAAAVQAVSLAFPAAASIPEPDREFLIQATGDLEKQVASMLPEVTTCQTGVDAAYRLLVYRRQAMADLQNSLRETSPEYIETQDLYDEEFLRQFHAVTHAGFLADTTRSPEALARRFIEKMGVPPQMGDYPLAFMIIGTSEMAFSTMDSLQKEADFPRDEAGKIALHFAHALVHGQMEQMESVVHRSKAEQFRCRSVLFRMRCPKDGGGYQVMSTKGRIHANKDISTVYFLNCSLCREATTVEFVGEISSQLNKLADKQNQAEKPKAPRPTSGLDP